MKFLQKPNFEFKTCEILGEKQRPTTISEAGESNHGRRAKADKKQASTPFKCNCMWNQWKHDASICCTNTPAPTSIHENMKRLKDTMTRSPIKKSQCNKNHSRSRHYNKNQLKEQTARAKDNSKGAQVQTRDNDMHTQENKPSNMHETCKTTMASIT